MFTTARVRGAVAITATAVLATVAMTAAPVGALGRPPSIPPATTYNVSCHTPPGPTQLGFSATISIFARPPGAAAPGAPVDLHAFRATIGFSADLISLAESVGLTSLSGQVTAVDIDATNTTTGTVNAITTPVPVFVPFTPGQQPGPEVAASFTVPTTPATVGPWTAEGSGTITYTPGDLVFTFNAGQGVILTEVCTPSPPSTPPTLGTTAIQ